MVIFTVLLTLFVLLRDPATQTYTARIMAEYLSDELNADIKINELTVTAFFNIVLKGVEIKDHHQKPLLTSKKIQVNFNKARLGKRHIDFSNVLLDSCYFNLIVYRSDSLSNLTALFGGKSENPKETAADQKNKKTPWVFNCSGLELKNGTFAFDHQLSERAQEGLDLNYFCLQNMNIDITDIDLQGDSVIMRINELSLKDKFSGFVIDEFEGDFVLSGTLLSAKNLKVDLMDSKLDLDFSFSYDSFKSFNDFEEKIYITADIRPTRLNMADIGYFAPELFAMRDVFDFSLQVEGTVSDFKSKHLDVKYGELTHFKGDVNMKGLPDILTTQSYAKIDRFISSANDIESFSIPGAVEYIDLSDEFMQLGECELMGTLDGVYNDFDAYIVMRSEAGNFLTDMKMKTNETGDITRYTGWLRSKNFNVGKVFNAEKYFGTMNIDVDFDGSGLVKKDVAFLMNGTIDSLQFKGNTFNELKVNGQLFRDKFKGNLRVDDESAFLNFDGLIDYSQAVPDYDFKAKIRNAKLYDLNIVDHDSTSLLSTNLDINFSGDDIDSYNGFIQIDSTFYHQSGKDYFVNDILLDSRKLSDVKKQLIFRSDYIDGKLTGEFLFENLVRSVNDYLSLYMPSVFADTSLAAVQLPSQNFEFDVQLKNTEDISEVFYPDIQISPDSKIHGLYNSAENKIHLEFESKQVNYKGIRFKEFYAKSNNDDDSFFVLAGSNDMVFKESSVKDSLALGLENLNLLLTVKHDSIDYRLRWDDYQEDDDNRGYLAGYLKYFSPQKSELKIYRTDFLINNLLWSIDENNLITFDSSLVWVQNLNISNNVQRFGFSGKLSQNASDTLKFEFKDWEFSNFDLLVNVSSLDIDGKLNGTFSLSNIYGTPNIDANLSIDDLVFNEETLGRAKLHTFWDPFGKTLYSDVSIAKSEDDEDKSFVMVGAYEPGNVENQLDFDIELNNFNFVTLEPFVSSFMSDVSGSASGNFRLFGMNKNPIIEGDLKLQDVKTRVDYLNVEYELSNKVEFRENEIRFENLLVKDSVNQTATASGRITHDYFKNFDFDIKLYPENMSCLNTTSLQNELFYGKAKASGEVYLHGPVDNMVIDVTMLTERGTSINIPLNSSFDLVETNYIVFVNTKDNEEEQPEYKVDLSGLSINLNLSVNQNADIQLFLPYNMGRITADGTSEMDIKVNSRGDFEIYGDYIINRGNFLFTLQNIVNRRFSIFEGGKISWNGNPYEALIDVRALYKTKASVAELDPDITRRVNVDCYLSLKEQLFDPVIDFSFKLPNVDKTTEQLAYAKIDTTNDAVMNQQLIYLLVLGSFSYDQVNTSAIGASSFNLISNQLSNLISQISKDFDIGINYRPGDNISREELEVALSTQLFDNRVTIDGNVGVIGFQGTGNSSHAESDIVGDINIEVKLTDDGRWRVKAFNRSNISTIENVNEYDNLAPNTQGIGILNRKEFDSFSDLFKRKKKKTKVKNDSTKVEVVKTKEIKQN